MEIDVKKITECPTDLYECIDKLVERNFNLIESIHIFQSILENDWSEYSEFHIKRINEFLEKFAK